MDRTDDEAQGAGSGAPPAGPSRTSALSILDQLHVDRRGEDPQATWQRLMSPQAVVRMDGTTHRGEQFVALLGALRANIRGGTVQALEEVEQVVDGQRRVAGRYLFVNELADGSTLTGEEHIFLALDADDRVVRLVGVTRPVQPGEDLVGA